MKRCLILFFFYCGVVAQGYGEMIGPVEFQLPAAIREDWEISNKLENRKRKTIVYTPKETPKCDLFFEANIDKRSTDVEDVDAIKADLANQFSDMKTHLDVIVKGTDHLLYEWNVKENGRERIHGWSHLFSLPNETVTLTYQTDDPSHIDEDRSNWLPALKDAKMTAAASQ